MIQRSVFSLAKANPRELIRSNFNTSEIEHRALTYLPDDLLRHLPQSRAPFSLLDGFKASLPDEESLADKVGRRRKRGQKQLEAEEKGPPKLLDLKKDKVRLDHKHEMMGIRKTMCASEIKEIDDKIANLNTMRKVILDRLADLEQEEHDVEQSILDMAERIEVMEEEMEDELALATKSPRLDPSQTKTPEESVAGDEESSPGFMSESIYEKLPKVGKETASPRSKRKRQLPRRISMPVLHEHMEPGSRIRELQAHNDTITALDFDAPFGTMVTAALDDTVRVWDLNAGRCMGMLEGHLSSVRCLQVEDNFVATGSMDASIRLWDLSQADYTPPSTNVVGDRADDPAEGEDESATGDVFTPRSEEPPPLPPGNSMADCPLFKLEAHVAEVTALHFQGSTLVSGSADKTLRQWDLEKGRCVQTLDVIWAAAQAATTSPATNAGNTSEQGGWWRPTTGRIPNAEADFVGALQVFQTALAVGTADGMVRLWDLRSGMVHRSLVGHTGPVTALQFDDVYMVTGSQDRSIRVS